MTKRKIIFAFLFVIWTAIVLNIGAKISPEQSMADKLNAVEHDSIIVREDNKRLSEYNSKFIEGYKAQCIYIKSIEGRLSKYESVNPVNCAVSSDIH